MPHKSGVFGEDPSLDAFHQRPGESTGVSFGAVQERDEKTHIVTTWRSPGHNYILNPTDTKFWCSVLGSGFLMLDCSA